MMQCRQRSRLLSTVSCSESVEMMRTFCFSSFVTRNSSDLLSMGPSIIKFWSGNAHPGICLHVVVGFPSHFRTIRAVAAFSCMLILGLVFVAVVGLAGLVAHA